VLHGPAHVGDVSALERHPAFERVLRHVVATFLGRDQEVADVGREPVVVFRVGDPIAEGPIAELKPDQPGDGSIDVAVDLVGAKQVREELAQVELREGARGRLLGAAVGIMDEVAEAVGVAHVRNIGDHRLTFWVPPRPWA